jgi:hypothetical protein
MTAFHMICGFLQGNDLITYEILILQGSLTLQKDQLGNNPFSTRKDFNKFGTIRSPLYSRK